jgi:hypothetical protein
VGSPHALGPWSGGRWGACGARSRSGSAAAANARARQEGRPQVPPLAARRPACHSRATCLIGRPRHGPGRTGVAAGVPGHGLPRGLDIGRAAGVRARQLRGVVRHACVCAARDTHTPYTRPTHARHSAPTRQALGRGGARAQHALWATRRCQHVWNGCCEGGARLLRRRQCRRAASAGAGGIRTGVVSGRRADTPAVAVQTPPPSPATPHPSSLSLVPCNPLTAPRLRRTPSRRCNHFLGPLPRQGSSRWARRQRWRHPGREGT